MVVPGISGYEFHEKKLLERNLESLYCTQVEFYGVPMLSEDFHGKILLFKPRRNSTAVLVSTSSAAFKKQEMPQKRVFLGATNDDQPRREPRANDESSFRCPSTVCRDLGSSTTPYGSVLRIIITNSLRH